MGKKEHYREELGQRVDWDAYLLQESRLPGPRANLELAFVVAEEGDEAYFDHLMSFGPEAAPTDSPYEFLAFCGVLGQGQLLAGGNRAVMKRLRRLAADPRWRIREAVALALQRFGREDMEALLAEMSHWSRGSCLEQRAAAAALCEPGLLADEMVAAKVLQVLDGITESLSQAADRKEGDFKVLRKGLAYCWSVAVAAHPAAGRPLMEKWFLSQDPDVRWLMKENLKKKRLERMDEAWVSESLALLSQER